MKLVTVTETHEFSRAAKAVMSDVERTELIGFLAANPESGISLGGGVRKLRFARTGSGKSAGFRVIHFYRADSDKPLFLIAVFAKNAKSNLTNSELAQVVLVGEALAASYGSRQ